MTAVTLTDPARNGPAAANRGASFPVAATTIAARTVRKFLRTPQLLIAGTAQGLLFLVLFRYVFGGAITRTGSLPYVDFLVPGFITTGVLFMGMSGAAGTAEDLEGGLVDRLRSLPVPPASIVCGRVLGDTTLVVWGLAVQVAAAFAVGFGLHGGLGRGLEAAGLCVLYGFAFCWLFVLLGLVAGSAQSAQALSFLVFPLTFVSSAYVPVRTMPGWMQAFASRQPITAMVDAVRILAEGRPAVAALGHPLAHYLPVSLAWSAGLIVVFAPLAVRRLRRA